MKHIQSPNSRSTLTNVQKKDIQPNAVDLRIGKLFEVDGHSEFVISEDSKQHRKTYEMQPDADGWFTLRPGHYEVVMENTINVGQCFGTCNVGKCKSVDYSEIKIKSPEGGKIVKIIQKCSC